VLDGDDLYWTELRPAEKGRMVIVRRTHDGKTTDMTPLPFNARTRVHEYGGGAFAVDRGTIYFSNFADQRLYRQDPGATPQPITPAVDSRYADGMIDRKRNRLICVREDHTVAGEAVNTLATLDLDGRDDGGRVLVSGNNFYSSPRLSPDGMRLAWLTWNHPNMPWDGTELGVGELNDKGKVASSTKVAGGVDESIFQPEWSPDGTLYFVSDRTGWWNLYRWRAGRTEPLCKRAAEFGGPQWVFGLSLYAFESKSRIVCAFSERGASHLAMLDTKTRTLAEIETPYSDITCVNTAPGRVIFIGGSPTTFPSIVQLDLKARRFEVLRRASDVAVDPGYLSVPEAIRFPAENGQTAHAFFYAPKNRDYAAPAGDKPPLLVISHGGPTGATSTTLNLNIQYWTSRGLAVVDVNYGGSTGYGRAYRQRLNGQWGVVDVNDCANAARYLIKRGSVDANRIAIRGGSAGGYTTLAALVFTGLFKAGASHFGISELEVFVKDTHKFESRYCESLVGPYPEKRDLYQQRSPINFIDRLSCPLILFQGLEDKIVPPNQSEMMFDAARKKGLPAAYVAFEGEQHGFRQAKNIQRALDGELYFYGKVFRFELAEPVEAVRIENL
jgi:dipeptidyl aminopeptidase/acylaminoacyl peptidase